jgi:hypothetical protein
MLDVLLSVGLFPHRVVPATMLNDTVSTGRRLDDCRNPTRSGQRPLHSRQLLEHTTPIIEFSPLK